MRGLTSYQKIRREWSWLEPLFSSPAQMSIGVIQVYADVGEVSWLSEKPLESLLSHADGAMYRNKLAAYQGNAYRGKR